MNTIEEGPGFNRFKTNGIEKELKISDFEEFLKSIWQDRVDPSDREIEVFQHCKTHGLVSRGSHTSLNLCSDPECYSCEFWYKAIDEAFEKYEQ